MKISKNFSLVLFSIIAFNLLLIIFPSYIFADCVPTGWDGVCPDECTFREDPDCPRELEVRLPPEFEKKPLLERYVQDWYNFALIAVALICFGALVYGGIRYITSTGNPAAMADAKDWISGAFLSLFILLGAYLIITTINPELWFIEEPEVPTLTPAPGPSKLPTCLSPQELYEKGDRNRDCIIDEADLGPDATEEERAYLFVDCCGPANLTPEQLARLGDVAQDCEINAMDMNRIAKAFGSDTPQLDLDNSGEVDKCDISLVASPTWRNFVKCGAALNQELLIKLGDLNQDCVIDIRDANAVAQLVGSKDGKADLNGDGEVDVCDVSIPGSVTYGLNCGH